MSIFLKVERFGAEARLLQVRGLFAEIGEDQHGILTANSPCTVFFSLYCLKDRCLLKAARPLFYNERKLETDQQAWLIDAAVIAIDDYQITTVCSSAAAEALAHSSATVADLTPETEIPENLPSLIVKIANLSQTFPLFPGLELSVGSDPEASIVINLVELPARHLTLTNISSNPETPAVLLRPRDGQVKIKETTVEDEITLKESTKILLEPTGLELELRI